MEGMKDGFIDLWVSKKHLVLHIVLFVLAFAAAVFFITRGILSVNRMDEGMYEIEGTMQEDSIFYYGDVRYYAWLDGKSDTVNNQYKNLQSAANLIRRKYYMLLDEKEEYEGIINLASINAHPNQIQQVDKELYDILKRAWMYSSEHDYSCLWGIYNAEWNALLTLSDPERCRGENGKHSRAVGIQSAGPSF